MYLKTGETLILEHRSSDLESYLKLAAKEFDEICTDVSRPKVGVVGEITALTDGWMEIKTKNGVKLLNVEYIKMVEERPVKKK